MPLAAAHMAFGKGGLPWTPESIASMGGHPGPPDGNFIVKNQNIFDGHADMMEGRA
jgi:hypothetical protein